VRLAPAGPLKKPLRIVEKSLLRRDRPGCAELVCDVVRDMFVASSMLGVAVVVSALLESDELVIVRIKDRFTMPTAGGWRDVLINYHLVGSSHICEIQVAHEMMLTARSGMAGHAVYARVRCATELLESLGLADQRRRRDRLLELLSDDSWTKEQVLALGCFCEDDVNPAKNDIAALRKRFHRTRLSVTLQQHVVAKEEQEIEQTQARVAQAHSSLLRLQAMRLTYALHLLVHGRRMGAKRDSADGRHELGASRNRVRNDHASQGSVASET